MAAKHKQGRRRYGGEEIPLSRAPRPSRTFTYTQPALFPGIPSMDQAEIDRLEWQRLQQAIEEAGR